MILNLTGTPHSALLQKMQSKDVFILILCFSILSVTLSCNIKFKILKQQYIINIFMVVGKVICTVTTNPEKERF